jgi:Protein of unknown function (DUF3574)
MRRHKIFASVILLITLLFSFQSALAYKSANSNLVFEWNFTQKILRTELYFGTDKNDGTQVSDEEWNKFLAEEVTPKFPDGFTILEGYGQFRDSGGKIIREKSKVLILLYPLNKRKSSNLRIEKIRTTYKKKFHQESVLRIDFRQFIRVSF